LRWIESSHWLQPHAWFYLYLDIVCLCFCPCMTFSIWIVYASMLLVWIKIMMIDHSCLFLTRSSPVFSSCVWNGVQSLVWTGMVNSK
jgi:hypothetical protein